MIYYLLQKGIFKFNYYSEQANTVNPDIYHPTNSENRAYNWFTQIRRFSFIVERVKQER